MLNFTREPFPLAFETENLRIRRYKKSDAKALYRGARESISEVYPFLPWCHPDYAIEDSKAWLQTIEPEWKQGRTYAFAIFAKQGDNFLGGCGVNRIDEHPVVNLGYWIRSSAARRGVATEATVGLAQFAFAHLGVMRVEIIMSTKNTASRRVAEKAAAQYEGVLRNRLFLHGEAHDAHVYSLIP